jgi:8-oxo-dGTP diphosphatase
MDSEIAEIYGNKVRIRVCGLCWKTDSLLLVKHRMGADGFWSPPGGGVEFGEPLHEALKREFLEETGLSINPGKFLFGCELINLPLHAIELFFEVEVVSGTLKTGADPELQIVEDAQFLTVEQIQKMPEASVHHVVRRYGHTNMLRELRGFHRI